MDGNMMDAMLELMTTLAGSVSSVCMLLMVMKIHVTWQRYQPALALVPRWQRAPPYHGVCGGTHRRWSGGAVNDGCGWQRCKVRNPHDERVRRRP